jgi:hypothetical protein
MDQRIHQVFVCEITREMLDLNPTSFELNLDICVNFIMQQMKEMRTISLETGVTFRVSVLLLQRGLYRVIQNLKLQQLTLESTKAYILGLFNKFTKESIIVRRGTTESDTPELVFKENANILQELYHVFLMDFHGVNRIVFFLNFKNKGLPLKSVDLYKIVDDFTKLKIFEIDCLPYNKDYKTHLGAVRVINPDGIKILEFLNGGLIPLERVSKEFLRAIFSFDRVHMTEDLEIPANSTVIKEYTVNIYDMDSFNAVRSSCGWKLTRSSQKQSCQKCRVLFVYSLFDFRLYYECIELEGLSHSVKIFRSIANWNSKDAQAYEIISEECKNLDFLLEFSWETARLIESSLLEAFLKQRKELLLRLFNFLQDQKSTK